MRRADLLAALEKANVPAGPINNLEQVFDDPQVKYRGMQLALKSGAAAAGNAAASAAASSANADDAAPAISRAASTAAQSAYRGIGAL